MAGSVIVSTARTPMGRLSGALASLKAVDLGGAAIAGALERGHVAPDDVDAVVMGQVLTAGQGQIPARQAAVRGGIPMTVPATNVNKVCLSGIDALYVADRMVAAGDADVVVAGGMESMTNAPHLLQRARAGYRLGNGELIDSMILDGLWCAFYDVHMGSSTERSLLEQPGITRALQDEFAAKSHERAAAATKEHRLADEIVPVEVKRRGDDPAIVETDEGIRPGTTVESLARLAPAFEKDGVITAGNASQISDGAAAVVLASREAAERLGLEPLAELVGFGNVAGPDTNLLHQPSRAIRRALERANVALADVDLFEINEAFAAVVLASMRDLGIDDDIVNVNGGAIALGHPIGMSGARIVATLAHELRRRGGGLGAAALCGGGGQGEAALIRVV